MIPMFRGYTQVRFGMIPMFRGYTQWDMGWFQC